MQIGCTGTPYLGNMKQLLHFLKCLLITGEDAELEFTLKWYDLLGIAIIIIGIIYAIVR